MGMRSSSGAFNYSRRTIPPLVSFGDYISEYLFPALPFPPLPHLQPSSFSSSNHTPPSPSPPSSPPLPSSLTRVYSILPSALLLSTLKAAISFPPFLFSTFLSRLMQFLLLLLLLYLPMPLAVFFSFGRTHADV